jgi:hypothetical protein
MSIILLKNKYLVRAFMNRENYDSIIQDLNMSLDRINDWIKNCDTKASIMIAVIGVFLTMLVNDSVIDLVKNIIVFIASDINIFKIIYIIIVVLLLLSFLFGFFLLIFTLNPIVKTNIKTGNVANSNSVYFFGSIANMKFSNYSEVVKNPDLQIESLKQQVYVNSHIATKKYKLFRKGLYFSFFGFIGLIILVAVGSSLVIFY